MVLRGVIPTIKNIDEGILIIHVRAKVLPWYVLSVHLTHTVVEQRHAQRQGLAYKQGWAGHEQ